MKKKKFHQKTIIEVKRIELKQKILDILNSVQTRITPIKKK